MKRIVIGTDGRDSGNQAARYGVELARETGAAVTFVCVWQAPSPILGEPVYSRAVSAELRRARLALDGTAALAAEAEVQHETEIVEGDTACKIAEVARERDADLIVLGSGGHGAPGSILGTVSNRLLRHGPCPVLVVKRPAARKRAA